jgi:hypothetical protein
VQVSKRASVLPGLRPKMQDANPGGHGISGFRNKYARHRVRSFFAAIICAKVARHPRPRSPSQSRGSMTRDEYYMTIAMAVRKKANCLGRKVPGGVRHLDINDPDADWQTGNCDLGRCEMTNHIRATGIARVSKLPNLPLAAIESE